MSDIQPIESTQSLLFNYSHIDVDTANYLQQNAQETRILLKRTAEDIIKIGKNLLEAKTRLPHGQFLPWVKAELGISQSTAWRFMQAAKGKPIKSFKMNDFTPQIEEPKEDTTQWDDLTPEEKRQSIMFWREVFNIFRETDPRFDSMLTMFHNRGEYLTQCGINPDEDDCLALMRDEIEQYLETPVGKILKLKQDNTALV